MQTCNNCQSAIPDDARTCPYCGSPVQKHDDDARRRLLMRLRLGTLASPLAATASAGSSGAYVIASALILVYVILGLFLRPPAIQSTPPVLAVTPLSLDFGKVVVGDKLTRTLKVVNSGKQPLMWQASAGSTSWVTLDINGGAVDGGKEQTVKVAVDTSQLRPNDNPYLATLAFSSTGGNRSTEVMVTVLPRPLTPLLCLDPAHLDFGTMTTSMKQTQTIAVINCGGQRLRWSSDTGSANWIVLNPDNGALNQGQQQTVNITLDTSQLSPSVAPYTASLAFSSNGGKGTVEISAVVALPPSPSPSTPISPSPSTLMVSNITVSVNPASLAQEHCDFNVTFTYTAVVSVDPGNSGGTVNLTFSGTDGTNQTSSITFNAGDTSQKVDFSVTGFVGEKGFPPNATVTSTSPNTIQSNSVGPTDKCIPVG